MTMQYKKLLVNKLDELIESSRPVVLHEPFLEETNAKKYLNNCIDSGWISSAGKWVEKFQDELCNFTKAKYCCAVVNGTSGLRLALHIVGVRENEEVLMPSLTFVATANAVSHLKAFPNFVDISLNNLGIDSYKLKKYLNENCFRNNKGVFNKKSGRRIAALVAVHVFGMPSEIIRIKSIADEWKIPIVEDAAEALGSFYKEKHCGTIGDIGVMSFNGNKIISTGGGGALITNNKNYFQKALHLSTTAKVNHPWLYEHDQIAWNDRMPNINAALGYAQLEVINKLLQLKKEIFLNYNYHLGNLDFISIHTSKVPEIERSNFWLNAIFLKKDYFNDLSYWREKIIQSAFDKGIFLRPVWKPLHLLPMYKNCFRDNLSSTEEVYPSIINLPSIHSLKMKKLIDK